MDILQVKKINEEIERKNKKKRERDLNDIRKLLALPEGRRFMWRIFSETGLYKGSFTGNSTTFFNEGKRDIGLWLLNELMKAKPEVFSQMQQEFFSEFNSLRRDEEKKDE